MRRLLHVFPVAAVLIAGCNTMTASQMKGEFAEHRWVVDAPIEKTFRTYKDYADERVGSGFEGLRAKSNFYGTSAELSIALEGNPIMSGPFLHFEMTKLTETQTRVGAWARNDAWREHAQKFKALMPNAAPKGESGV